MTANVASYLLMAAVTFAVSNRIYKVTWETAALRLTSASFILFGGIAYLFPAETVIWVVPVKILLLDNGVLGMVRQQQELLYGERYSEIDLSDNPDFADVARAFGIKALSLDTRAGIDAALRALLDSDGPCLLHVSIDPHTNVWPFVPPNTANDRMLDAQPHRPETTHA